MARSLSPSARSVGQSLTTMQTLCISVSYELLQGDLHEPIVAPVLATTSVPLFDHLSSRNSNFDSLVPTHFGHSRMIVTLQGRTSLPVCNLTPSGALRLHLTPFPFSLTIFLDSRCLVTIHILQNPRPPGLAPQLVLVTSTIDPQLDCNDPVDIPLGTCICITVPSNGVNATTFDPFPTRKVAMSTLGDQYVGGTCGQTKICATSHTAKCRPTPPVFPLSIYFCSAGDRARDAYATGRSCPSCI